MPSSQVQAQGVQVTRQEEPHHWRSPDLRKSVVQKILCQQFFPTTSPHQWQKSQVPIHILGELQFWSRTRNSQIATHGHSWQSCCIEPWSNWLSCLGSQAWLTVTKARISWVNQRQHANQHRLHRLNVHSLAVVVQYYLRLLYDHMWNDLLCT